MCIDAELTRSTLLLVVMSFNMFNSLVADSMNRGNSTRDRRKPERSSDRCEMQPRYKRLNTMKKPAEVYGRFDIYASFLQEWAKHMKKNIRISMKVWIYQGRAFAAFDVWRGDMAIWYQDNVHPRTVETYCNKSTRHHGGQITHSFHKASSYGVLLPVIMIYDRTGSPEERHVEGRWSARIICLTVHLIRGANIMIIYSPCVAYKGRRSRRHRRRHSYDALSVLWISIWLRGSCESSSL